VVPSLPPIKVPDSFRRQCGEHIPDRTLIVTKGGDLANAVVFVAGAHASAATDSSRSHTGSSLIDQRGCTYFPPVVALLAGGEIEFLNSDPLLHNVHAKSRGELFNFAMPLQGLKVRKRLPEHEAVVRLSCDVHPWMQAVIRTFTHPQFGVTDASGRYQLSEVPSGRSQVVFWHQRFGEKTREIELVDGQIAELDLEWRAAELRL
jgi:plastocyanin